MSLRILIGPFLPASLSAVLVVSMTISATSSPFSVLVPAPSFPVLVSAATSRATVPVVLVLLVSVRCTAQNIQHVHSNCRVLTDAHKDTSAINKAFLKNSYYLNNILQNIFNCVLQNKVSHTGLEENEGKLMMTGFSFE